MRVLLLALLVAAGCVAPASPDAPGVERAAAPGLPCPEARAVDGGLAACLFRTGYAGLESTLGICPRTGAVFVSPAVAAPGPARAVGEMAVARSRDGGASWTLHAPAIAGRASHAFTLDPYGYVDPATCRVFHEDLASGSCALVSWSDDAGESWAHALDGCTMTDHATLFAGPPTVSTTRGYPNVVYRCAIGLGATADASFATACQKSLDGGLTWLPTGGLPYVADPARKGNFGLRGYCDGAVGHGVADARGRVYLPKGWCGEPWLAMSDDEGRSWRRVRVSTLGMAAMAEGPHEHEASVGVDAGGAVHYAWLGPDRLPYLAVSRDGGATWTPPRLLSPPGVRETALLSLAASPGGVVAVAYYGSVDAPPVPPRVDCEASPASCLDGLLAPPNHADATWGGYVALVTPARVRTALVNASGEPFVRGACGPVRCQAALDFQDVQVAPDGSAWAAFVDVEHDAELVVARLGPLAP